MLVWCAERDLRAHVTCVRAQMTTHLFDKRNTRVLIYILLAINLFQVGQLLVDARGQHV